MRLKVVELEKTCGACPAQWEGKLEDGRMIYARFRFGWLSIQISKDATDDIGEAVRGKEIFGMDYGGEWCGTMDFQTLADLSGAVVNYDEIEVEEKTKKEGK